MAFLSSYYLIQLSAIHPMRLSTVPKMPVFSMRQWNVVNDGLGVTFRSGWDSSLITHR